VIADAMRTGSLSCLRREDQALDAARILVKPVKNVFNRARVLVDARRFKNR
jgi:hypothetical protein